MNSAQHLASLTLNNSSTVQLAAGEENVLRVLVVAGTLTLNDTSALTLAASGYSMLVVGELTMTGISQDGNGNYTSGPKLDLANNWMVIDYTGASPLGAGGTLFGDATGITALAKAGYESGNTVGLVSSQAAADPFGAMTVALADVGDASWSGVTASFFGQTIDSTAIIIRPVYIGDLNLDGVVDPTDFSLLSYAFASNLSACWQHGDLNYDNLVDPTDFSLISFGFAFQGPALPPP